MEAKDSDSGAAGGQSATSAKVDFSFNLLVLLRLLIHYQGPNNRQTKPF